MTETSPPTPPTVPPTVPPSQKFPTWKQGFVLCLGGLGLFLSACFGCLATLNTRGNPTNDALFTMLAILALVGGLASFVGGILLFMRILRALFSSKPTNGTTR
jgi:hypothetical protein